MSRRGRRWLGRITAVAIGFAGAMIVMAVAIYFGYVAAYAAGGINRSVCLLGLEIYHLTAQGNKYIGTARGLAMGAICGLGIALALLIEELRARR